MAIHKTDGVFVISSYRVWRPGVYDTERAARYAFRFTDEQLIALMNAKVDSAKSYADRVIRFEDLKGLRENKPTPYRSTGSV